MTRVRRMTSKKTSAQLDREIAEALAGPSQRAAQTDISGLRAEWKSLKKQLTALSSKLNALPEYGPGSWPAWAKRASDEEHRLRREMNAIADKILAIDPSRAPEKEW